jgi:hypothetical protein
MPMTQNKEQISNFSNRISRWLALNCPLSGYRVRTLLLGASMFKDIASFRFSVVLSRSSGRSFPGFAFGNIACRDELGRGQFRGLFCGLFRAHGWLGPVLLAAWGSLAMAHAQTAHAGANVVVGSGFSIPDNVAVDASGDVFVADHGNNAVYEIVAGSNGNPPGVVNSSSAINRVGSGFSGPYGVAVDASGDVFVANDGNNAVYEIVAGSNGNPAGVVSASSTVNPIGSGFTSPTGVAVDAIGDVFVADPNNNAVYEIVAVSGVVSSSSTVNTLSTGGSPNDVAVDGSGNVFVADLTGSTINEIVAGTQKFPTTEAGSTSVALTLYFTFDGGGTLASTPYVALTQGKQGEAAADRVHRGSSAKDWWVLQRASTACSRCARDR